MAARLMSKCWLPVITGLSLFYFAEVVSQSRDDVILGSTFTTLCHVTLILDGHYRITWLKEHQGSDPPLTTLYHYTINKTKTHTSVRNTSELDFLDGRILQAEVVPPHVAIGKLNIGNLSLMLRVPDARITDAGNYSCFAQFMDQGPVDNISGQVIPQTIDVIVPPTSPTLTRLKYPNRTVAVTCNSTHGHPPPQIQWYRFEEKFTPDRDMVSRGTACLQEMDAYCLVPSVSETITLAVNMTAFYRCETVHSTGTLSSPTLVLLLRLFDIDDGLKLGHSSSWKYAGVGFGAALIIASLVVMANFDRVSKRCRKNAENTESDRQPKGQYKDKRRSTESTDVYDIENETQLA